MSGSPRSGSRTRFSTPEPDLDDHRNQPETLPRVDPTQQRSRRGTLASLADSIPPITLTRPAVSHLLLSPGIIARDFDEHAIADDDASIRSGQHSPIVARRTTFRRPTIDPSRRSVASSRSRSSSPPNSVDAFAGPQRRRRAGTITSQCSDAGSLQRTLSDSARGRRRPIFSDTRTPEIRANSISSSVEDDVCFPPLDNEKMYTIDFEDLDEFAAEVQERTPVMHPHAPHTKHFLAKKAAHNNKPGIFHDLRKQSKHSITDLGKVSSEDTADEKNEKAGVDDDPMRSAKPVVENSPSRCTFFSSEADETIHASELASLPLPDENFRGLFSLGPEGGVWWLDMMNPSEEEVAVICKAFGIHPLTREDICTGETREKVELFKQYYFVCFRSYYKEYEDDDEDEEEAHYEGLLFYAVVFREGLLTFSFRQNEHAYNVRKRIGRLRDYVNLSADWICYALIDDIVDGFTPAIDNVEHESDAIEDHVFISRVEDAANVLRQIGQCRKRVMSLSRLLSGKADVIKGFAKRCNEQYSVTPRSDVGLYLSDVQDHVVTNMSNLAHFEKMLSRSHANYLAQISMTNISQGNQANQMLNKITVLASVFVPLNLVAGLWGMNVGNVPGKNSDSLGWFFGIIGVMMLFSMSCFLLARRMRFI